MSTADSGVIARAQPTALKKFSSGIVVLKIGVAVMTGAWIYDKVSHAPDASMEKVEKDLQLFEKMFIFTSCILILILCNPMQPYELSHHDKLILFTLALNILLTYPFKPKA